MQSEYINVGSSYAGINFISKLRMNKLFFEISYSPSNFNYSIVFSKWHNERMLRFVSRQPVRTYWCIMWECVHRERICEAVNRFVGGLVLIHFGWVGEFLTGKQLHYSCMCKFVMENDNRKYYARADEKKQQQGSTKCANLVHLSSAKERGRGRKGENERVKGKAI